MVRNECGSALLSKLSTCLFDKSRGEAVKVLKESDSECVTEKSVEQVDVLVPQVVERIGAPSTLMPTRT